MTSGTGRQSSLHVEVGGRLCVATALDSREHIGRRWFTSAMKIGIFGTWPCLRARLPDLTCRVSIFRCGAGAGSRLTGASIAQGFGVLRHAQYAVR